MKNPTQISVIAATTAEEFQSKFNSEMNKLKDFDPKFEFNHSLGYCAYITYSIEPKSNLQPKHKVLYKCYQCPHLQIPKDKRIKHCPCSLSPTGLSNKNAYACDLFYDQLRNGVITPEEVRS